MHRPRLRPAFAADDRPVNTVRLASATEPISGSNEMNARLPVPAEDHRTVQDSAASLNASAQPHVGQQSGMLRTISAMRSGRLVRIWYVCRGVSRHHRQTRATKSAGTRRGTGPTSSSRKSGAAYDQDCGVSRDVSIQPDLAGPYRRCRRSFVSAGDIRDTHRLKARGHPHGVAVGAARQITAQPATGFHVASVHSIEVSAIWLAFRCTDRMAECG